MINQAELDAYPAVSKALDQIRKNYYMYAKTYNYILENFDQHWLSFADELLALTQAKYPQDKSCSTALQAFIRYSHEFFTLQIQLNKEGKYKYSSYAQVAADVYHNKRMEEYYLDGLFLSQVFWPNHYKMCRYYQDEIKKIMMTRVLEVPCGTGIYSYLTLQQASLEKLLSVDLSQYSADYTRSLLKVLAASSKSEVQTFDIFDLDESKPFDLIICGELLEHLEEPNKLLLKLKNLLTNDGRVFLTTAIFAAAIDHIYLFESAQEVDAMLNEHFVIVSQLILPTSLEEYNPSQKRIPMNYACVLKLK